MAEKMNYLILISLGPVQEFIVQARKTRDLWFGSYLLSELSKEAARELENQEGELIFPYHSKESSWDDLKVANRIVGIVETENPRGISIAVRRAAVMKWFKFAEEARSKVEGMINPGLWKSQIHDFIEFHAVWVPISTNQPYNQALEQADSLMAARKTLRDFKQNEPKNLFGDQKSSLDSGRESVIFQDKKNELFRFGIKTYESLDGTAGEPLDAISMVKRLSMQTHQVQFPSVCDIAFLPFRQQESKSRARIDEYYTGLKEAYGSFLNFRGTSIDNYESALFYENRIEDFVEEQLKPDTNWDGAKRKSVVQDKIKQLQNLYSVIPQPPNYYAFVMCDGDQMGKYLRHLKTKEEHQRFSKQLSKFAEEAGRIIKDFEGQLVYSGGDDVMAYLPLQTCLDACEQLRMLFCCIMQETSKDIQPPTLSIGLAIVHQLERLGEVRQLAQEAEQLAKQKRNELAIIVRKRHGADPLRVSFSFEHKPVQRLLEWKKLYQEKRISAKLPHDLKKLYLEYLDILEPLETETNQISNEQLILLETTRVFMKKKPQHILGKHYEDEVVQYALETFKSSELDILERLRYLAEQMLIAIVLADEEGPFDAKVSTNSAT